MELKKHIEQLRGFRWPLFLAIMLLPLAFGCGGAVQDSIGEGLAWAFAGLGGLICGGGYLAYLRWRTCKFEPIALCVWLLLGFLITRWLTSLTLYSLIDQLTIGLIMGCLYALIALGYTLVYGVIKLINFAHGDIYMLGAFIGFYVLRVCYQFLWFEYGVPQVVCYVIAVIVAAVICAILAVIMERLAYRPLRGSSRIAALITAVGVSFMLENAGIIAFGASFQSFEPKKLEVYNVQLADSTEFGGATDLTIKLEKSEQRNKSYPASEFEAARFARMRVLTKDYESAWSPVLEIPADGSAGYVELSKDELEAISSDQPQVKYLGYQRTETDKGAPIMKLAWQPSHQQQFMVPTVFHNAEGQQWQIELPVRDKDGDKLSMPGFGLVIIVMTALLLWALNILINKSMFGISMRALSFDMEAAKLMGVNTNRVISQTFAVGGACAAVAGCMIGIYVGTIDPLMGILPGLKAFVAAVVGGIGSIPGAAAGGLIMGISEALVKANLPGEFRGVQVSNLADAMAFAILIVVLLFKPSGIFGSSVKEKV